MVAGVGCRHRGLRQSGLRVFSSSFVVPGNADPSRRRLPLGTRNRRVGRGERGPSTPAARPPPLRMTALKRAKQNRPLAWSVL